ncbi:MAG TPA: Clp protease N-terminal domain-containing protein [Fimbriimonadaceae bacterium]|nr:Clp protease N-terminal domain-containing protein [Fimbriimonadaceae bacterium]
MWQRFSERARRAIFHAQEETQRLNFGFISPEHILLGLLLVPDSTAVKALERLGVDLNLLKSRTEFAAGKGKGVAREMTLIPSAKRTIDLAYDAARAMGNDFIGSEHILAALAGQKGAVTFKILKAAGVEPASLGRVISELQLESRVVSGGSHSQGLGEGEK